MRRFGLAFVCVLLAGAVVLAAEPLRLANGSYVPLSNEERIYVRMAGHGPNAVILLPGNNCSGAVFEHLLSYVRAIDPVNDAYTFYAFDYRGSGGLPTGTRSLRSRTSHGTSTRSCNVTGGSPGAT